MAKGRKGEKLLCIWKGYIDLNEKNDNYSRGTRRDCYDPKIGVYYQTKLAYYNSANRCWRQDFTNLQESIRQGYGFESLFFFLISEDGQIVERIYEIPEEEVIKRSSISIYEDMVIGWYEQYRIKDVEEIKKINEIWKKIINSNYV